MWTYVLRRLLLMIPTLVAILLINFAILRLADNPLRSALTTQGSEEGALDPRLLGQTVETSIRQAALTGRHLPALINTRGFLTKDRMQRWLEELERAPGREAEESRRRDREGRLWLSGPFAVQPLYEIIADDALAHLHGPASFALTFTAFTPLSRRDLDRLPVEKRAHIINRNASLRALRIPHENTFAAGYTLSVDSDEYTRRRQAILQWWQRYGEDYSFSRGQAFAAVVLETGFIDFFGRFFTGNLISERFNRPVFELIGERWYVSFWLQMLATLLAWSVAIPLGIRSARRKNSLEDQATSNSLFLLWSLPEFFIGSLLLFYFCTDREGSAALFPNRGLPPADSLWSPTLVYVGQLIYHGFLPLLVLSYGSFTVLSRYMRGALLDQMSADYARTARAKGASEDRIVYGHNLRNSMVTMITMGSGLLAALFGGFVVVEYMFSINGLGTLLLEAARDKDAPLIMASTVISVSLLLLSLLIADLMYAVVDPRIRSRYV
ncbi:MAG: ABC transporter permease [Planctomycetota bacterium]|nr:MAG: ABC transporter permease [Planctomycetota bacterium]